MKGLVFLLCLVTGISFAATEAHACVASTGYKQIFFPTRPKDVPAALKVLKVRAPLDAENQPIIHVEVLEEANGTPANADMPVKIAPSNATRPCEMHTIGLLGSPAYIVGVYVRGADGITYFHALWLDAVYPKWREPKDWRSYIVDPKVRAAEGQRP
ncbi:MAG: hypothetical protein ABIR08_03900 [Sphingomonas sp.]